MITNWLIAVSEFFISFFSDVYEEFDYPLDWMAVFMVWALIIGFVSYIVFMFSN